MSLWKNFLRDFDSGKWCFLELVSLFFQMPVRLEFDPPLPANSVQAGVATSLLYSGSKFRGSQKSKGNCYDVEVILQVNARRALLVVQAMEVLDTKAY